MHLVLPPREVVPTASADTLSTPPRPTGQEGSLQPHTQLPFADYLQQNPGLRFRGPTPASIRPTPTPTVSSHPTTQIRATFRERYSTTRQAEDQQSTAHQAHNAQQAQSSANHDPNQSPFERTSHQTRSSFPQPSSSSLHSWHTSTGTTLSTPDPGVAPSFNTQTRESIPLRRAHDSPEINDRRTRHQAGGSVPTRSVNPVGQIFGSNPLQYNPSLAFGTSLPGSTHSLTLLSIQQVIIGLETQLNWGIIPPIEQLSQIRSSLYQIFDAQYQNPLVPRDGFVEGLLSRLSNLYVRADQLRMYQARIPSAAALNNPIGNLATPNSHQANVYLLSSPSGYQALVTSLADTATVTAQAQATTGAPAEGHAGDGVRPAQPHGLAQEPRAAAINNAINQALIHRRAGANIGPTAFARNARRIWLFIRLYFFCYLFSDSGTWSRVILVSLAVLISLLSETNAPQQFQGVVFGPIQRHLEGLVHLGGDVGVNRAGQQPANAQGDQSQNRAGGPAGGEPTPGVQQQLRRVERAVALFLASLVPGIGERHIEVQNAAEAAIQNRERERERVQEEEQGDGEQRDTPAAAPQGQQLPAEQENRA